MVAQDNSIVVEALVREFKKGPRAVDGIDRERQSHDCEHLAFDRGPPAGGLGRRREIEHYVIELLRPVHRPPIRVVGDLVARQARSSWPSSPMTIV